MTGLAPLSYNLTEELSPADRLVALDPTGATAHDLQDGPPKAVEEFHQPRSSPSILVPACVQCRPLGQPDPNPSLLPGPVSLQGDVLLMFGRGHVPSLAHGCKAQYNMEHEGKDRKKQCWGWHPLPCKTGSVTWANRAFSGLSDVLLAVTTSVKDTF